MYLSPRLLGIPYDAGSSHLRGAAKAPPLIRQALHSPAGNSWTEELRDLGSAGGLTDAGDLSLPDGPAAFPLIEAAVASLLEQGYAPIALGGDHSITWPIVRAVARVHAPLTVLQIDSHPDLYDEFEGDRCSHACPFARIMEEGLAARLVQVGIRAATGSQRSQIERFGVEVIDMHAWYAGVRPGLDGAWYLSLDLDGLDPAFAPGVAHREPGGLSTREVLELIRSLDGRLVGADVVEYNPGQDLAGLTAATAAKLVKEIAGRLIRPLPPEPPPA